MTQRILDDVGNFIKSEKVQPFEETVTCPECRCGQLSFTGESKVGLVSHHLHKCDNCGHDVFITNNIFPRTVHKKQS